jgi:hypothetical protein
MNIVDIHQNTGIWITIRITIPIVLKLNQRTEIILKILQWKIECLRSLSFLFSCDQIQFLTILNTTDRIKYKLIQAQNNEITGVVYISVRKRHWDNQKRDSHNYNHKIGSPIA